MKLQIILLIAICSAALGCEGENCVQCSARRACSFVKMLDGSYKCIHGVQHVDLLFTVDSCDKVPMSNRPGFDEQAAKEEGFQPSTTTTPDPDTITLPRPSAQNERNNSGLNSMALEADSFTIPSEHQTVNLALDNSTTGMRLRVNWCNEMKFIKRLNRTMLGARKVDMGRLASQNTMQHETFACELLLKFRKDERARECGSGAPKQTNAILNIDLGCTQYKTCQQCVQNSCTFIFNVTNNACQDASSPIPFGFSEVEPNASSWCPTQPNIPTEGSNTQTLKQILFWVGFTLLLLVGVGFGAWRIHRRIKIRREQDGETRTLWSSLSSFTSTPL